MAQTPSEGDPSRSESGGGRDSGEGREGDSEYPIANQHELALAEERDPAPSDDEGRAEPADVVTERRTLIVGRTTRRSHELELIEPKGDAEFPGPWQVRAVVDERDASSDAAPAPAAETEPVRRGSWLRVVDPER